MPRASFSSVMYLLVSMLLPAQSPPIRAVDPFFLIEYDPAVVRFDAIPPSIADHCPQLKGYYIKGWVYAHAKTEGADYFVVDGYVRAESEAHPGTISAVQEDGSVIIELRPRACFVDAAPYIFFSKLNPQHTARVHISDKTLATISTDLLERYAKAFGGKRTFLQRIQEVKRDKLPESLQRALESFEKDGKGKSKTARSRKVGMGTAKMFAATSSFPRNQNNPVWSINFVQPPSLLENHRSWKHSQ